MELNPARAQPDEPTKAWTCNRCQMTVSFAPEVERPRLPSTWSADADGLYCLSCRREMAGEAGVDALDEDASSDLREKTRSRARIGFEIRRDPNRPDNEIAKACRTSSLAVRRVRDALGIEPAGTI